MYCVLSTNDMFGKMTGLAAASIECPVNILLITSADDHFELLRVAEFFVFRTTAHENERRQRTNRTLSASSLFFLGLKAASEAAGLILVNPLKDSACSALSISSNCAAIVNI